MSDLAKAAAKTRLARVGYMPTVAPHAAEELDLEEQEEAMSSLGLLPSMPPPAARPHRVHAPLRSLAAPDLSQFAPLSAAEYFNQAVSVDVASRKLHFRAYYTPPTGSDLAHRTILVCHHGAGYSGLSFACLSKEITSMSNGECGVLAFDARRHGKTAPYEGSDDSDLSVDSLADDLVELLGTLFPDHDQAPSFLFVGHSMGGAVCVKAIPVLLEKKYRITGASVLDVVEGSALDALPHMMHLLDSRPHGFESVEEAIQWHVGNQTIRNLHSARISIPAILKKAEDNSSGPAYLWRTPLRSTADYWASWFTSLSSRFLAIRTARLLILAGTDRLDRELMIGQMQGKFQMEVVPGVGHMLHEDDPARIAEILVEFWKRNERTLPVGLRRKISLKKVGEE